MLSSVDSQKYYVILYEIKLKLFRFLEGILRETHTEVNRALSLNSLLRRKLNRNIRLNIARTVKNMIPCHARMSACCAA